ncbi:MAG: hypothetical protein R3B96_07990 [Pirellulaceae bacterium]
MVELTVTLDDRDARPANSIFVGFAGLACLGSCVMLGPGEAAARRDDQPCLFPSALIAPVGGWVPR